MSPQTVEPGTIVKVRINWPGTKGKRFAVKAVRPYEGPSCTGNENEPTVDCWELEGETRGKLRSFPLSAVEPVKGKTPDYRAGARPPLIGNTTRKDEDR